MISTQEQIQAIDAERQRLQRLILRREVKIQKLDAMMARLERKREWQKRCIRELGVELMNRSTFQLL